jgi:hypothetical protein
MTSAPCWCLALHASLAEPVKLPAEEVVVVEEEAEDQLQAIRLWTIIIIHWLTCLISMAKNQSRGDATYTLDKWLTLTSMAH